MELVIRQLSAGTHMQAHLSFSMLLQGPVTSSKTAVLIAAQDQTLEVTFRQKDF